MALAMARLRSTSYLLPSSSASRFFSHPRRRCPLPSLASAAAAAAAALPFLILKRRTYPTSSTPPICSSSYSPPSSSTEAAEAASASTAFHLHNTLTKRKEPFRPRVEGKVGMYVCGVTAYDLSHIGHARVYVFFDVLYRYLKHLKYDVVYVRNFTDVDDKSICRRALSEELISIGKWKIFLRQLSLYTCPSRDWANNPTLYQIIARANELRENPLTLSSRYCNEFHYDMAHLHCLPPTVEPRVSTHMNQIIDMINQILVNGFAYNVDGDVYFSVDKSPSYGRLSGRRLEDNQPGQRVAVDSRKKNPADFALWKSSKDGELFWESPWGPGRPGWHIECSAMSAAYLGYSFDIHGGGVDLVFPHHENEIAQSCAACRESNVGYWVHNGFVDIGSEKMSKSLGNFVTIRKVIDVYHPLSLRLFLIGKHYRSTVNYSIAQLETASDRLYYIYQTICDCDNSLSEHNKEYLKDSVPNDTKDCTNKFREDFENSLADDLNTPIALASFSEPLKIINDLLHTRKGKKQPMRTESLLILSTKIKDRLDILGLKPSNFSEALFQLREKALRRAGMTEEQVLQKVEERSSARKAKLYEESDEIRKKLAAVGIALMDGPDETSWRPAVPLHVQDQLANAAVKNEGISSL